MHFLSQNKHKRFHILYHTFVLKIATYTKVCAMKTQHFLSPGLLYQRRSTGFFISANLFSIHWQLQRGGGVYVCVCVCVCLCGAKTFPVLQQPWGALLLSNQTKVFSQFRAVRTFRRTVAAIAFPCMETNILFRSSPVNDVLSLSTQVFEKLILHVSNLLSNKSPNLFDILNLFKVFLKLCVSWIVNIIFLVPIFVEHFWKINNFVLQFSFKNDSKVFNKTISNSTN